MLQQCVGQRILLANVGRRNHVEHDATTVLRQLLQAFLLLAFDGQLLLVIQSFQLDNLLVNNFKFGVNVTHNCARR